MYADTYLVNCCQTMCYFPEDCIFYHCEIPQFYKISRVDDVSSLPQSACHFQCIFLSSSDSSQNTCKVTSYLANYCL